MMYGSFQNEQRNLPTELATLGDYLKLKRKTPEIPTRNQLLKYCGTAVKTGRPLGKVMIILTGENGHEILNTINCWYDDPKLCPHDKTYEAQIVEYRKKLNVTAECPSISADWSLIKLPILSASSDADEEAVNYHKIKTFSSATSALSKRVISPNAPLPKIPGVSVKDVRIEVFPNLVLLVIKATDIAQSGLEETVLKLRESNLVDLEYPNLLVVATQSLSISPLFYNKQTASITKMVQDVIHDILGLQGTKVIFVDNNDENHFEKPSGCDFLELPNGQLSHQNLMEAIVDTLDANADFLGKLLCIWYYKTTCPDTCLPPLVIPYDQIFEAVSDITEEMVASTREEIVEWRARKIPEAIPMRTTFCPSTSPSPDLLPLDPPEPMELIGYGYSPITSQTASCNTYLLSKIAHEEINVNRKAFRVPQCAHVTRREFTNFQCFTFEKNELLEMSHKVEGAWNASSSLNFDLSLKNKWNNSSSKNKNERIVYARYEPSVGYFRVQDPEPHINTHPGLVKALNELPEEFSQDTAKYFKQFFEKWGTHIVTKAHLGGSLTISMTLKASNYNKESLAEIDAAVKAHLPFLNASSPNTEASGLASTSSKISSSLGIQMSGVQMEGGIIPHPLRPECLNEEVFKKWMHSVKDKPSMMTYDMEFFPYYDLLTDEQDRKRRYALQEATHDYRKGILMLGPCSKNQESQKWLKEVLNDDPQLRNKKACFPPFVSVSLANGTSKKISELTPMDNLIAIKYSEGIKFQQFNRVNSPFQIYLHRDPEEEVLLLCMKFSNGKVLVVSPEHLLFVYDEKCQQLVSKMAGDLKVNRDKMVYFDENGFMTSPILVEVKGEIHKGIYAPLTSEGTFIADGFLVSCYADVNSFQVPHFALAPLRLWNYCKDVFDFKEKKKAEDKMQIEKVVAEDRIHPYLTCLMHIRNFWNKI